MQVFCFHRRLTQLTRRFVFMLLFVFSSHLLHRNPHPDQGPTTLQRCPTMPWQLPWAASALSEMAAAWKHPPIRSPKRYTNKLENRLKGTSAKAQDIKSDRYFSFYFHFNFYFIFHIFVSHTYFAIQIGVARIVRGVT